MSKILPSDNTDATSKTDTTEASAASAAWLEQSSSQVVNLVWPDKTNVPAIIITMNRGTGSCDLFAMPGQFGFNYPGFEIGSGVVFASPFDADGQKIGSWHWIEGVK